MRLLAAVAGVLAGPALLYSFFLPTARPHIDQDAAREVVAEQVQRRGPAQQLGRSGFGTDNLGWIEEPTRPRSLLLAR